MLFDWLIYSVQVPLSHCVTNLHVSPQWSVSGKKATLSEKPITTTDILKPITVHVSSLDFCKFIVGNGNMVVGIPMEQNIFVSSANSKDWVRRGPTNNPCGTPHEIYSKIDGTQTGQIESYSQDNFWSTTKLCPEFCVPSLWHSILRLMVSITLDRSKNMPKVD